MAFYNERLREIRILKQLTQQQLAIGISVTKQAISRYEKCSIPGSDVMEKIMELFALPIDFFSKEIAEKESSPVFWGTRSIRSTNKKREEAQIRLRYIYYILKACESLRLLNAVPLRFAMPLSDAKQAAIKLRREWNLKEDLPVADIGKLLTDHGVYLFAVDLHTDEVCGYAQQVGEYPIIVINNKGNMADIHFMITKLLAYFILFLTSKDVDLDVLDNDTDDFANCFLVSDNVLEGRIPIESTDSFVNVAKKWNIPPREVIRRFDELKLWEDNKKNNPVSYYTRMTKKRMEDSIVSYDFCSIREALEKISEKPEDCDFFWREVCLPKDVVASMCPVADFGMI